VDVDAQTVEARSFPYFHGESVKRHFQRILVIQTAFIGDVILTLPLVQALKRSYPKATVDVIATPGASDLFGNHPAVNRVITYDKHGLDRGLSGFRRLREIVAKAHYELAVVPHRSIRSSLLARLANIPVRIGFDRNAGKQFLTHTVSYRQNIHEIERNLCLLKPLEIELEGRELPTLYPAENEKKKVDRVLRQSFITKKRALVAIAPATVWNTKRWPRERFAEVSRRLRNSGCSIVLIGSDSDRALCDEIAVLGGRKEIVNTAGKLSLLESAELIRRARVILSNDSAPMHMGVAVRTPVVAVFGATVPAFGFSPYGKDDVVVETLGLPCRPCSIHGGKQCPIDSFDCMMRIMPEQVVDAVLNQMNRSRRKTYT
jgi:heptosyltransferase-2